MARIEGICSSCFASTKYSCLKCHEHFCIRCSVFENDETFTGWRAGRSVAHCERCFQEKMECEMLSNSNYRRMESSQEARNSSNKQDSIRRKRADESEEDEDGPGEDAESNDEVDNVLQHFREKQTRKNNKKPGRKTRWCPKSLDDLIDIVVNSTEYKTTLIFTNTKNQKNGPVYAKILEKLKARASARGDEVAFTVNQLRNKFKKCISCCKQAALTVKTATGIKRFQEDHGYGKWFNALFEVVKTRDSCQPELALEPSSSGSSNNAFDGTDHSREDAPDCGLFVPIRNVKKVQSSKHKLDSLTSQMLKVVEDVVSNDPTKDLMNFMREEMEKSRQHEMKLFQLMLNHRASGTYDHCFNGVPPSPSMAYGTTGLYPTWQSGGGQSHVNQAFLPESSSGSPFPFDLGKYQPL